MSQTLHSGIYRILQASTGRWMDDLNPQHYDSRLVIRPYKQYPMLACDSYREWRLHDHAEIELTVHTWICIWFTLPLAALLIWLFFENLSLRTN